MSLFKILQQFTYQPPDDTENYDSFSLTCARLNADNEQQKDNVIITSHSGFISILQPTISDDSVESQSSEYQPQVVYEAELNEPILGVLCGNFIQYTQKQERQNVIAILHPRKLVIYSLLTAEGIVEYGQQSKLQMLHQHDLQKSAFTFCKGNFGGVKGKEFICVMFLDGSLKFFEQDGISQNCVLPGNRTIPTAFVYVPRTDCFLILAPNWDLECYRYLTLSESLERRFNPIWSLNLGEYILDLNSHQISNTESLIVLLGENNLICISDTGKMKFIKKLDYTPVAFCSFTVGWYWEPDCKLMIAIATDNGSLLIYQHSTLVWCAELMTETIALKRGNFSGLAGAIVSLSSTGKLSIGYLGSDPHIYKVPPLNLSKLDYEKSKMELEEMEKEINSSVDNSDIPFINAQAEKDLELHSKLDFDNLSDGCFSHLHLKMTPNINLEQVQLFIIPNPAFIIPVNIFFLADLQAHEKHSFETEIYLSESEVGEIFSTTLTIMVSFINKQSIARVLQHSVLIPLNFAATLAQPQKDGIFKVTLNAAVNVDIGEVFKDLSPPADIGQALAIRTLNSQSPVTLIAAKSSNRYRLQSSSLVALAFMFGTVIERLSRIATTDINKKALVVKSIPSSTIDFLLSCVEKHCAIKDEMKSIIKMLTSKSIEMRLFERCFLVKMQGKAPTESMEGIEMLLRDTYNEILSLTMRLKELKTNMRKVQTQLTSTIYFIRNVIEYADLPQKITENLLCIMRPSLMDFHEQSWIEASAPYVDYLYGLYQSTKAGNNQNQFYDNISFRNDFSLTRFSKQLRHVLSILIVDNGSSNEDTKTMENVFITMDEEQENEIKINESEWGSKLNPTHEIMADNDG